MEFLIYFVFGVFFNLLVLLLLLLFWGQAWSLITSGKRCYVQAFLFKVSFLNMTGLNRMKHENSLQCFRKRGIMHNGLVLYPISGYLSTRRSWHCFVKKCHCVLQTVPFRCCRIKLNEAEI